MYFLVGKSVVQGSQGLIFYITLLILLYCLTLVANYKRSQVIDAVLVPKKSHWIRPKALPYWVPTGKVNSTRILFLFTCWRYTLEGLDGQEASKN